MEYLNYEGLKYYHSKVKELIDEKIDTIPDPVEYEAGDNIVINNNTISAVIPDYTPGDNILIKDGIISAVIPDFDPELITTTNIDQLFAGYGYTVNLNGLWQLSTTVSNPNSSLYEGVYLSFAHKGLNSTIDIMYIDIYGYTTFKLYIRSYAESVHDYVIVSKLDLSLTSSSSSSSSSVYAHTSGKQNSNTSISGYTIVEFTNIDGGNHRISIGYRKDGSVHSNDDRGYVLIPKNQ